MAPRRRMGKKRQPLVPISIRSPNHDLSCWYCEFKFFVFNEMLFSIGSKYSRVLRTWFTFGVCFSLLAFVGVTMAYNSDTAHLFLSASQHFFSLISPVRAIIFTWPFLYTNGLGVSWTHVPSYLFSALVWQSASAVYMYTRGIAVSNLTDDLFLHHLSLVPKSSLSLVDAGYMIFSTIFSVFVHEFGHAVAAASEGVRIEYVAVFLATLFPGALVSFDNELLDGLPRFTNLRIYCAGIWHNTVLCGVCLLSLLFLPLILHPLYIHGNNPMVLDVSPRSPLYTQLVYGDVIVSVDGNNVHDPNEWIKKVSSFDSKSIGQFDETENLGSFLSSGNGKGYCVPVSWLDGSKNIPYLADEFGCPDGSKPFVVESCSNSSYINNGDPVEHTAQRAKHVHCLVAKDIVGFQKCGSGWTALETRYGCTCSEGESCLSRVKVPGVAWVEVGYSTPYDLGCYFGQRKREDCRGTFVIEEDAHSIVNSVCVTAYRPRWIFFSNGRLPAVLEKLLTYTTHISAGLVLLNILPVSLGTDSVGVYMWGYKLFFMQVVWLDGNCIMEVVLSYVAWWNPQRRLTFLKLSLFLGTALSVFAFSRVFLYNLSMTQGSDSHHYGG